MTEENIIDLFGETQPTSQAGIEQVELPPDPLQGREFLAHEFLLWLWFKSEHDFGAFNIPGGPVDLWFDDRLSFLAMEESKVISTFSGGAPSTTPEAKLSILSGKVIGEARIGIRRGENEWSFILRAQGGDIRLHGLKLPVRLKEGAGEMTLERMFLLDVVIGGIEYLFRQFFAERTSSNWQAATVPEMRHWLLGEE